MSPRNNQPWKRPKNSYNRKVGTKGDPKQTFLIVCEGEKTEPRYFEGFRVSSAAVIDIEGTGKNTESLVDYAISLRDAAHSRGESYDQIWCVFDRDSFLPKQFNDAIQKAENSHMKVAYSNEAFEIWYLLHFIYTDSALSRTQYKSKLSSHLKKEYKKNSVEMYSVLADKKADAIRNAERLARKYSGKQYSKFNPGTTVHLLVNELDKYSSR